MSHPRHWLVGWWARDVQFYGYPYQLSTASARLQAMFCQSNLLTAPSLPIAISSPAWLLAFHCATIERCLLASCASPGLQLPLASRARNVHLRSRCQRAQLICAGLFQLAVTGIPSLSAPANGTHLSTFTIGFPDPSCPPSAACTRAPCIRELDPLRVRKAHILALKSADHNSSDG